LQTASPQAISEQQHPSAPDESGKPQEGAARVPLARGTLADAALPGAAFHPAEYDVEVSQTSLAGADELLKNALEEAMRSVNGTRAFLAIVDTLSGELALRFTAGEGWTDEARGLRVNVGDADDNPGGADGKAAADNASTPQWRQGITRHVVVNSRPYWTGDVANDPYYLGFFDDVCSEVAVPIRGLEGGTIGVINVESTQRDAFTEKDAALLTELARRVAIIVAMAEHQLREEALIAIGKDLSTAADLDSLMRDVVEQATKILRADDCSLFLMDETARETDENALLQLVANHGPQSRAFERLEKPLVRYRLGEGLTGWVAKTGKVLRVGDPRTDARWKGLFMEAPAGEIAAVIAVPVWNGRGKPGVLRVIRRRKGSLYFLPQEFSSADEEVLVTLAGQLAVAIDRTRLMRRLLRAERMAAWGEMSARSAHMIGNTVFGIKGHLNELTYLFNEGGVWEGDEEENSVGATRLKEARDLSGALTRGIYRLEEILGEFRDFVLATQLHLATQDINQVLRNVTAESFPRSSNIDLVLNLAPSLPPVEADEAKLKRAFSELIENSIDFQPEGGQLIVRTALTDEATARRISPTRWDGPAIQIEFIDRGPGLSEQDRARVFSPFYTRKAKGMGLGLSIVKGIIEAHDGAILEVGDRERRTGDHEGELQGAHFLMLLPPATGTEQADGVENTSESAS
jgi:signal transduction histidine kinase